jgi:hypothetical protein
MTQSSSTISSTDLASSLDLVEIKPGVKFSVATLRDLLPDAETVLFFGKVYELDYKQLSNVMHLVLTSDLAKELFRGDHSTDLQGYLLDGWQDDYGDWHDPIIPLAKRGQVTLKPEVPTGEILPEVWKSLQVEVAKSIKDVASRLQSVVGLLPGKQGKMVFGSMLKLNAKRPTLGDYKARIHHAPVKENLLILDVSGSMTSDTVQKIVDDVVALSYMANASMAIVSNTCTYWEPGAYDTASVLDAAEYSGTHYETLADLLDRDWGNVITVADYDSSYSAKQHLAGCSGHIDTVLDISLVNKPTFLAECVGQRADRVQPLLIGRSQYVLESHWDKVDAGESRY